jgi:hypothetical protein
MGRFQNNPSIGWLHPKFLHAHPLAWANKKLTCKPITLSIQPTFDSPTFIPAQKVFPQCLCRTEPTDHMKDWSNWLNAGIAKFTVVCEGKMCIAHNCWFAIQAETTWSMVALNRFVPDFHCGQDWILELDSTTTKTISNFILYNSQAKNFCEGLPL